MGIEITTTTKEFSKDELQQLKDEGSELLEFIRDENNKRIIHRIFDQYLNKNITQNTLENLINNLTLQIGDKKTHIIILTLINNPPILDTLKKAGVDDRAIDFLRELMVLYGINCKKAMRMLGKYRH